MEIYFSSDVWLVYVFCENIPKFIYVHGGLFFDPFFFNSVLFCVHSAIKPTLS